MPFFRLLISALLLNVALASAAFAAGPPDLTMTRGALVVGNQVLFVSDGSGDPCKRPCSAERFIAEPGAVASGLWSLVQTEGGVQWAYDGALLYLWREIGVNYGQHFFTYNFMPDYYGLRAAMIKDIVGEGFAVPIDDPSVASRPFIERSTLARYSLTSSGGGSGTTIITTCVDHTGRTGPLTVTTSAGFAQLDTDALDFATVVRFTPAKNAGGEPIAVCGATIRVVWPEDGDSGGVATQ